MAWNEEEIRHDIVGYQKIFPNDFWLTIIEEINNSNHFLSECSKSHMLLQQLEFQSIDKTTLCNSRGYELF